MAFRSFLNGATHLRHLGSIARCTSDGWIEWFPPKCLSSRKRRSGSFEDMKGFRTRGGIYIYIVNVEKLTRFWWLE